MTCESVMRVLRAHKDSVMAVLEAFVYDPLLNWRLMDCKLHADRKLLGFQSTYLEDLINKIEDIMSQTNSC